MQNVNRDVMDVDYSTGNSSPLAETNQKAPSSVLGMGRELLNKAKFGNAQDILDLVAKGAPFATDWIGTSPLHWSVFYNHLEVTETLLLVGICKDAKNKVNRTPLHVAAQKGHHKVLEVLLSYGADVNCKDILKMTPLHWAAEHGSVECVKLLLDYGADIAPVSVFDKTPPMLAKDCNHYEIYKLLEETAAMDPSVRKLTATLLRQKSRANNVIKMKTFESVTGNSFNSVTLKVVPKKQKIGILVDKQDPVTGERKLELIRNEALPNNNSNNNSFAVSPNLLSSDILRSHAIILDSKNGHVSTLPTVTNGPSVKMQQSSVSRNISNNTNIARQNSIRVIPGSKLNQLCTMNSKTKSNVSNSKKIITIKADQLINMTKEKKVIITDSRPISNLRYFEGKLYTEDQKDELAVKVNTKLQEAKKKAEDLVKELKQVNEEIDGYNKLLGSLHKTWPPLH